MRSAVPLFVTAVIAAAATTTLVAATPATMHASPFTPTTAPTTTDLTVTATAPAAAPVTQPARPRPKPPATRPIVVVPRSTSRPTANFPTWGVALTPPAGWAAVAEPNLSVMAQWVPRDRSPGTLTIVVTPLLQRTARRVAEEITRVIGGKVEETLLDDRSAWRVSGGSNGQAAIFTQRDNYLYEIRYQRTPPNPAELEALQASWRWSEVDSPVKHPELRPDMVPIQNQLAIRMPAHMRPWIVPPGMPPTVIRYGAVDITAQRIRTDFFMDLQMEPIYQNKPLNELATIASDPLQKRFGLEAPLQWRPQHGKNDRIISDIITQPVPPDNPNLKPGWSMCSGFVALDGQRRLLVSFLAMTEDADARAQYMVMADEILASIVPLDAVMPAAAASTRPATPRATPPAR